VVGVTQGSSLSGLATISALAGVRIKSAAARAIRLTLIVEEALRWCRLFNCISSDQSFLISTQVVDIVVCMRCSKRRKGTICSTLSIETCPTNTNVLLKHYSIEISTLSCIELLITNSKAAQAKQAAPAMDTSHQRHALFRHAKPCTNSQPGLTLPHANNKLPWSNISMP
jgi:hypothetical protein